MPCSERCSLLLNICWSWAHRTPLLKICPTWRWSGGGEEPCLLEVGDVLCDGRGGVEDPDPGLQLRPGIQDITNGEEGKSVI